LDKTIQFLDLSHCKFKGDFPKEIGNFINLTNLDISHNDIKTLPGTRFKLSYSLVSAVKLFVCFSILKELYF